MDFYEPRIATKDELEMLTGISLKDVAYQKKDENLLDYNDIVYNKVINELRFNGDRNNIENTKEIYAIMQKEGIKQFSRKNFWTGSAYDGTQIIEEESDDDLSLVETSETLPYTYNIVIKEPRKKDQKLHYKILTNLKDEKHVMEPHLAHMVKNDTKELTLRVVTPKKMITDVVLAIYADLRMETKVSESVVEGKTSKNNEIYEKVIPDANVNYTYAIEWKFKGEK